MRPCMPNRLFRKPDKRSGPAVLDREPVILPDARKDARERVRRMME
jgi:hypothetical protein